MITIDNADKALKDYYLQAVTAQLNDNVSPFFTAIEKTTEGVFGKDVKLPLVRVNNNSVVACAEDADLPEPYTNRYLDITAPLKNIYGTIEVSDKALRASRDSSGAFVNLINAEMDGLIASAKYNFHRMIFGNGSKTYCTVQYRKSSSTFEYAVDDASYMNYGKTVEAHSPDGTVTMLTVTDVTEEPALVTFDKAVPGIVPGTILIEPGTYSLELAGLGAIFSDQMLYGYQRRDESYVKPYCVELEKALTEEDLTDVLDYMEQKFDSKINMLLCSYVTRKKIAKLITDKKLVVNSLDVNTGIGAITVNGVPVYADKFCPDGVIYFVNTDDFVLCQLCDWEWLEDEDGKILKQVPGKAAYGATLVKYAELICKKPYAQAYMKNV